ncbi:MAG: esterase [Candidatus Pelagibacter sp.]|nr:esterase [Candidatus Pelagibacter sp.]
MNLKDIQKYLFPIKRIFSKYRQIRSLDQVKNFIQEQSAQVSQMTLYGYLKTRMGAKHVIMFENKNFLNSINIAKWNIYSASLIDCTFFCFSFLYKHRNFKKTEEANRVFFEILNTEKVNGMDPDAFENATKEFNKRYQQVNWENHFNSNPFEFSSNELYVWSPIADELKKLDKKIVINSMVLKWNNVQNDFKKLTSKFNLE